MIDTEEQFNVDFRLCMHGEVVSNGICEVCSTGSYAIGESKTEC